MLLPILKAIILGIVEGLTEFLPISSTGHLILINQFLSFDKDFTILFDIVIQLGAILAVLVYFWKKLWPFSQDQTKQKEIIGIWSKILIAVSPALIIGALFSNPIEEKLFNPTTVVITLISGGLILLFVERKNKLSPINSVAEIGYQTALAIGLFQCLAIIPGTSRSAATIIGAILLGTSRLAATEFSFFLAIPTMIAASGYSLFKHGLTMSVSEAIMLVIGFIVSFLTALLIIKFFLSYIQKHSFKIFGYYRIILGLLIIGLFLVF